MPCLPPPSIAKGYDESRGLTIERQPLIVLFYCDLAALIYIASLSIQITNKCIFTKINQPFLLSQFKFILFDEFTSVGKNCHFATILAIVSHNDHHGG